MFQGHLCWRRQVQPPLSWRGPVVRIDVPMKVVEERCFTSSFFWLGDQVVGVAELLFGNRVLDASAFVRPSSGVLLGTAFVGRWLRFLR